LLHLLFLHFFLKLLGKDEVLEPGVLLLLYGHHFRFFNNLLLWVLLRLRKMNRHLLSFFVREEDRRFTTWLRWVILVTLLCKAVSVPLAECFGVQGRLHICLRKLAMLSLLSLLVRLAQPVFDSDSSFLWLDLFRFPQRHLRGHSYELVFCVKEAASLILISAVFPVPAGNLHFLDYLDWLYHRKKRLVERWVLHCYLMRR
jgi:hypothetical protein